MLVIGLTGGIGSGKSTVAELFQQLGINIIDADLISREVVEPGQPALKEIADHFGEEILDQSGQLKRPVLRNLVFDSGEERLWLEQLLHPLINNLIRQRITECTSAYCIVMSPLILETEQKHMVNRILVIDISAEEQVARTLKRDGGNRQTIEAIIKAQTGRDKRLNSADDIVKNAGDVSDLVQVVAALHQQYLTLAARP